MHSGRPSYRPWTRPSAIVTAGFVAVLLAVSASPGSAAPGDGPEDPLGCRAGECTKGRLDVGQVAALAMSMGFSRHEAAEMVAIAQYESGWYPNAYNPNVHTRDLSYGLWQINMLNDLGPGTVPTDSGASRRVRFGIEQNRELFDPHTNARAARLLFLEYEHEGQPGYCHWSVWKGFRENPDRYPQYDSIRQQVLALPLSGGEEQVDLGGGGHGLGAGKAGGDERPCTVREGNQPGQVPAGQ